MTFLSPFLVMFPNLCLLSSHCLCVLLGFMGSWSHGQLFGVTVNYSPEQHSRGRERGAGLEWRCVFGRVGLSPATLPKLNFQGKRRGRDCRDSQASVYKVCLFDFHCYSNYKLRFSHIAALDWLCV